MLSIATIAITLLATTEVLADSKPFYALTIHSGSDIQYASVQSEDGLLVLNGKTDPLISYITDNAYWKVGDQYVSSTNDRLTLVSDPGQAIRGWSIQDGHVIFNEHKYWADKDPNGKRRDLFISLDLPTGNTTAIPLVFRPVDTEKSSEVVPDYIPWDEKSSSSSSPPPSSPSQSATTTTDTITSDTTTTATTTVCSESVCTPTEPVIFTNAAGKANAGAIGGLLAVGALLL